MRKATKVAFFNYDFAKTDASYFAILFKLTEFNIRLIT
ncbi:hypothetical protein Xkoz_02700 [Xenorhabdus kozodoii]|uniref:Uncharacterized protein n=1 Tax=Xenorhabdus kozodoii TaxID=351676 RepID=A0A2D0L7G8_9GAMM|nr:hypothetical protein Xkoz_02700 [Xenorhabdus kozodoii]